MIRVRFACGHNATISESATQAPICGCGETRVARTWARPPRFTGLCTGPYAVMRAMDPAVLDLTTAGPLKIRKESS